jgi:hypothetical protein
MQLELLHNIPEHRLFPPASGKAGFLLSMSIRSQEPAFGGSRPT